MRWTWNARIAGLALIPIMNSAAHCQDQGARDVPVTQAQIDRLAIKIEEAKPTTQQVVALLPGTVVPALNARIVAAAPFGGTVVQVHVLPGQRVTKGTVLATVSSREILEASSALAQAEAELQAADANARRRRFLADRKIQNPTMADEAEAQAAKVKAVIEQHKRSLEIGGIINAGTGSYTIQAPADGRVVEAAVMPGDKIEAMALAVTLDTSDELWIEAQVPSQLVGRLQPGDRVQVTDGPQGTVISISGSLDKLTRSAKLIARVPANSGLIAGQMVTLTISQQAAAGALLVPSSALTRIKDVESVFVRSEKGFTLVPVEVAGRSASDATITGDLPRGAQVAASGLPQLEQMLSAD